VVKTLKLLWTKDDKSLSLPVGHMEKKGKGGALLLLKIKWKNASLGAEEGKAAVLQVNNIWIHNMYFS
jgi:hypothetical protein